MSCQAAFGHPPLTHRLTYTFTHTSSPNKAQTDKLYSFAIAGHLTGVSVCLGAIIGKGHPVQSQRARQRERPLDRRRKV